MINVISLDFDFWLEMPQFENFDWAFREAPFFLNQVWFIRAMDALTRGCDLRVTCTLPNDEPKPRELTDVLAHHKIRINKSSLGISESHGFAYTSFSEFDDMHIIHIDAHHDMGYDPRELNCDNWLMELVKEGKVSKITMVYPKWRLRQINEWDMYGDKIRQSLDELGVEIEVGYGLECLPSDLDIKRVFLAHSGAWVPPWLDTYFRDLLSQLIIGVDSRGSGSVMLFGEISIDRMTDRDLDWDEIQKAADECRE